MSYNLHKCDFTLYIETCMFSVASYSNMLIYRIYDIKVKICNMLYMYFNFAVVLFQKYLYQSAVDTVYFL